MSDGGTGATLWRWMHTESLARAEAAEARCAELEAGLDEAYANGMTRGSRQAAYDMRERAAKLVFTVLNEGWSHKYSGFAGAVKERIQSLPIDEGGEP